jgi:hypothetical protein
MRKIEVNKRNLTEDQLLLLECMDLVNRFGVEDAVDFLESAIKKSHEAMRLATSDLVFDTNYAVAEKNIDRINLIKSVFL